MSTSPTPFDDILPSGNGASTQSTPSQESATPFDDILPATNQTVPSEGAVPYVPNARIRNLPNPAAKATSATDALLDGMKTGAQLTAVPATAIGLGEAGPVIEHLAEVAPNLDKAWKIIKVLGGGAYTLDHLKSILKVMGSSSKAKE